MQIYIFLTLEKDMQLSWDPKLAFADQLVYILVTGIEHLQYLFLRV